MRALRDRWTLTSRLHDRADEGHPEKHVLDCSIGWQNYQDVHGDYYPAQPGYMEADGDGFNARFPHLPRLIRLGDDGKKRIYPVPGNDQVWVQLHKPEELTLGVPTSKIGGVWTWERPRYTFRLHVAPSRVKFSIYLPEPVGLTTLHIPFESQGLTRQGANLLHNGEVVAVLRRPWVRDASGMAEDPEYEERYLDVQFGQGEIILELDDTGLVYPLTIDPPLDLQVGAVLDDVAAGYGSEARWYPSLDYGYIGWVDGLPAFIVESGFRFQNVTVGQGDTIDVAYLELYTEYSNIGNLTVNAHLWGEDADDTNAFSTWTDFMGRARTGDVAGVDWTIANNPNAWHQTPSTVALTQEIVNRALWASGNSQVYFAKGEDQSGANHYMYPMMNEDVVGNSTKLHIEFTAGGAGIGAFYMQHNPLGVNIISAGIG